MKTCCTKKITTRSLSLLLALLMAMFCFPVTALGTYETGDGAEESAGVTGGIPADAAVLSIMNSIGSRELNYPGWYDAISVRNKLEDIIK